jgi:hypothetical protein
MQATEAVEVLDEVGDIDIETLLGFPLLTKAEPYTARAQVSFFIINSHNLKSNVIQILSKLATTTLKCFSTFLFSQK